MPVRRAGRAIAARVLMLAWMNAEALRLTRETGIVHFWSRSRQALWKKGETSGNTLALVELRIDCDRDTRPRARAAGGPDLPHRHDDAASSRATTARRRRRAGRDDPRAARRASSRRAAIRATGEKSYTKSLLDDGHAEDPREDRRGAAASSRPSCPTGDDDKVVHEAADLLFHVMVGLTARKHPVERVLDELARRFGTSGHVEKALAQERDAICSRRAAALERAIPYYEDRAEQRTMSAAVARALDEERAADRRGRHRHRQDARVSGARAAVGQARRRLDGHARAAGSDRAPRRSAAAHDHRAAVHRGRVDRGPPGRRRTRRPGHRWTGSPPRSRPCTCCSATSARPPPIRAGSPRARPPGCATSAPG